MLDEVVTGKFKVLNNPYALPAKCAFCGIGHNDEGRRQFVDTSLDLDFYGVVYICSHCFNEIAESLGYISNDKWSGLKLKLDHIVQENEMVKVENDGIRDALHVLTGHRCRDSDVPSKLEDEPKSLLDNKITPSRTPERVEQEERKPNSSNSESGLSDVRGTSKSKSTSSSGSVPIPDADAYDIEL